MRTRAMMLVTVTVGMIGLAACGSTSNGAVKSSTTAAVATTTTAAVTVTTSTTGTTPTTGTTSTTSPSATATTGVSPTTTTPPTSAPPGAKDLVIDDAQRQQLLDAAAALNQIPADEYTGLVKGETYYAYDPSTGTYWAGASLVPSPNSLRAQVSDQDDGSYYVFEMPTGAAWKAFAVGATEEPGSTCPVTVPSAVLAVWDWKPGTCLPGN